MSASKKAAQSAAPKTKPTSATDKVPVLTDAPNASRAGRRISNKAVVLIILAVILAVLAFVALSYYQSQQTSRRQAEALAADKARFAKVEAEMAKAYERIVAAAGKPDKTETFKNCSRIAHKYDEGDLYCGIEYRLQYGNMHDSSQDRATAFERALEANGFFLPETGSGLAERIVVDGGDQTYTKVYFGNKMRCQVKFELTGQTAAAVSSENLFKLRCSGAVEQPVYTLAE